MFIEVKSCPSSRQKSSYAELIFHIFFCNNIVQKNKKKNWKLYVIFTTLSLRKFIAEKRVFFVYWLSVQGCGSGWSLPGSGSERQE